jgi:hypothetical protein
LFAALTRQTNFVLRLQQVRLCFPAAPLFRHTLQHLIGQLL